MQIRYGYDAFGNRILKEEGTTRTTYRHNALNQLIAENREGMEKSYGYDRRGNLTRITENGQITHQYVYGTLNRLEEAVDQAGKAAKYAYNGLGHRVGKQEGSIRKEQLDQLNPQNRIDVGIGNISQIRYTIDLTKQYHNLLMREEEQRTQTYFWDGNVTSYEENGRQSYYLQDELGSPLRIEDELGAIKESYGYGAFGEDLYGNQGEMQPFGYTGYQMDSIAGTYFAQAREYQPDLGRFIAQDKEKGVNVHPLSFDLYLYCIQNPLKFIDLNGKRAETRNIWSLKSDAQGREILWHYLFGEGETLRYTNGDWGEYMMDNTYLRDKTAEIVLPMADDVEPGTIKTISLNTSMTIQNGEDIIGYQYLHGTNENVGGYQIQGEIEKKTDGTIIYRMSYTWNDIMDPNFMYESDSKKAKLANIISFGRAESYNIHITWTDETIICSEKNEGWLAIENNLTDCEE